MSAVYLQRVGVVCALGDGIDAVRAALFAAYDGGLVVTDRHSPGTPLSMGCVETPLEPWSDEVPARLRSRTNALLASALRPLRAPVAEAAARYGPHRVAVIIGSSTAGVGAGQAAMRWHRGQGGWPPGFDYAIQEMGNPATFAARTLGVCGPTYGISTACSSGAKALAAGARLLRGGLADAVVAGGADELCELTVAGFRALQSVSAERCNPLSLHRRGINLGEGAAAFLMSREAGPVRLAGWGETSDAHHMSAPDPTGQGAMTAMRQALQRAGVQAVDVDYINLHGTATPQNDAMESLAVAAVCGTGVPVSSTKPLTGHALAAAGAVEAALAWCTLVDNPHGSLPPHRWDGVADPALPRLHVAGQGECLGRAVSWVLSNSFAFGGSNAALLFSSG
ncbi:MAG: beta-ketoacyl-ACP synthase [Betaproteobacteria bacterium]|nr:beta-ketoacyl-ACP synthase [Betaproteobacteria bacterium]